MVQDRKEPTFSSIKPESDEVSSHSNSGKHSGSATGAPTAQANRNQSRPNASRQVPPSAKSGLAVVALLVAFVGVAVACFSMWQLQQSQQTLVSAEARIAELEGRLNLTSSESDQSVTAIHEKLKWADSEIRKLWGVSNDTNKKAIKSTQDALATYSSNLKTVAADAKTAKESSETQKAAVSTLKALTNEQQLVLTQLSDDIANSKKQLNQLKELETKISSLDGLMTRVKTNEEAIRAIDSFRRSANADIQQIKQQMSASVSP